MEKGEKSINKQNEESALNASGIRRTKWMKLIDQLMAKRFMVVFTTLFIILVGLVVFEQTSLQKQTVKTKIIKKQVLVRRSKEPGFIYRGLTGKAIDVNTGKIVIAARVFSLSDSTVYLELDLQRPPVGTLVDYIRYKNGRYVDHGEIAVPTTDTKNLLFKWSINKLLVNVANGNWKIATYTNGILEKRIVYTVANNKLSSVNTAESVLPTDVDYQFADALSNVTQK